LQRLVEPPVDAGAALHVLLNLAETVQAIGSDSIRCVRRRVVEADDEERTIDDVDALMRGA
jgi:hypothetical protein